jgi:hypothetical protein
MGSPVGIFSSLMRTMSSAESGARKALIGGEQTASFSNSDAALSPAHEHPNSTIPQENNMHLSQFQHLRETQGRFYSRTETDTAYALRLQMFLDDKSLPARPSKIWVSPPKTRKDKAGKSYVILPETTIPVADILCYQNLSMEFSTAVSQKIRAKMISGVRLDASKLESLCKWRNKLRDNYMPGFHRRKYEKELRDWTSKGRAYKQPTLTQVGPSAFLVDRAKSPKYNSMGDEHMAIIQFPETIVDTKDLQWGDRGRLMIRWYVNFLFSYASRCLTAKI